MKSKGAKGKVLVTLTEPYAKRVQRLVDGGYYPSRAAVLFAALRGFISTLEKEAGLNPDDP